MADIKSSFDIAMERINAVGQATGDEKLKWKYVPEGEKVAVEYLKNNIDLPAAIMNYPADARKYVRAGVESVLLASISLPVNETVQNNNKKAMDGELILKKDKASANKIINQIKQVLNHYNEQGKEQRKQAYERLKEQYQVKLKQAVNKQLGIQASAEDLGVSVETLPQFQEEWRHTISQMDDQYFKLLDEFKKELESIT
jgi:hypothetical protein